MMLADEAKMPLAYYQNVRRWLEILRTTPWWQESHCQLLKILKLKA